MDQQKDPNQNVQSTPAPQITHQSDVHEKATEVAKVLGSQSYDLGVSSGAKPFTGKASLVEGGVDATAFIASGKTRPSDWYESQQKSAELLLKIYDAHQSRLDKDTANYVKTHESMLRDLASQSGFSQSSFKSGFESRYSTASLFGSKGVYNTLLALERIVDLYGGDGDKLLKDSAEVKLTIGNKVMDSDQRFAKAVVFAASAAPAANPVPNNATPNNTVPNNQGGTNGGLQQNSPQQNGGKTGFNIFQPSFDHIVPGVVPANLVPGSVLGFSEPEGQVKDFGGSNKERLRTELYSKVDKLFAKARTDKIRRDAEAAEKAAFIQKMDRLREQIETSAELDEIDAGWGDTDVHASSADHRNATPDIDVSYVELSPEDLVEVDDDTPEIEVTYEDFDTVSLEDEGPEIAVSYCDIDPVELAEFETYSTRIETV